MLERYNINDLFIASINATYPVTSGWDLNVGGLLMCGCAGYGYITILAKTENGYID